MPIIASLHETSTKKRYALRGGGRRQGSPSSTAAEAQSCAYRPNESAPSLVNVGTDDPRLLKSHISKSISRQHPIITKFIVYPGMTEFVRPIPVVVGKNESNVKRSIITRFSKKSRIGMKKFQCRIASPWEFRFELTYADDVMEDRTIQERAQKCSHDVELLKKYIERHFPELWLLWKKEWEPRKSGILEGQWCLHLHSVMVGK